MTCTWTDHGAVRHAKQGGNPDEANDPRLDSAWQYIMDRLDGHTPDEANAKNQYAEDTETDQA
jgi:hypothetical protein